MSAVWKLTLFFYNLLILALGLIALFAALGTAEVMDAIDFALSTPGNRLLTGVIAAAVIILTILVMIPLLRGSSRPKSIMVNSNLNGQVSITVDAIKVIINKAVKKIDGVKEIRSAISNTPEGLVVDLHMMINPEISIPDMTRSIQAIVKEFLENIGGLQVSQVRVLVDDFAVAHKTLSV